MLCYSGHEGGDIDLMGRKVLCASSLNLAQQISSCIKDVKLQCD